MSSFFMAKKLLAARLWLGRKPLWLVLVASSFPSVHWHFSIHAAGPRVNAAAHGLCLLEPLLPQPYRHIHRAHAVMTNHYHVIVGIEFLMRSRRHIAHRHQRCAIDARSLKFPGLANIEQRERFLRVQLALHLFGSDFVFHAWCSRSVTSPPTLAHASP